VDTLPIQTVEIITKKPCWLKSRATAGLAAQHVDLMAKNQNVRFEAGRFRHSRLPQHVAGLSRKVGSAPLRRNLCPSSGSATATTIKLRSSSNLALRSFTLECETAAQKRTSPDFACGPRAEGGLRRDSDQPGSRPFDFRIEVALGEIRNSMKTLAAFGALAWAGTTVVKAWNSPISAGKGPTSSTPGA
jgi:hypothetical protein